MTSEVKEPEAKKNKYPYIGKWADGKDHLTYHVLFHAARAGTIIASTILAQQPLGYYSTKFVEEEFKEVPPGTEIVIKV